MKNTIDKVIDKMIELTGQNSWSMFKVRIPRTTVEFYKFTEYTGIKNYIESKEIVVIYNGKIYSVNDFLNL